MMGPPLLFLVVAYVLGAVPASLWASSWFFDIDLREKGSGNPGATNALRILGWKVALPAVVFDVAKGWLPVWLFPQLAGVAGVTWAVGYGIAAILGHVFSIFAGFRGGKGVATGAGVLLALAPLSLLAGSGVWLLLLLTFRIASVASMGAALSVPVTIRFLEPEDGRAILLWFACGLVAFIFWAHRSNIRRLLRGEENRFGERRPGEPNP